MLALSRGIDRVCTSIIVAGELWLGAEKSNSSRLRLGVRAVLARTPILELSQPVDRVYAEVRNGLQSKGTPIGANDLWIAAHALAEGLVLVTDDKAEIARVEGLAIENWLR
jgi:tRNA(fMet)-specific endonuclease VapC